MEIFLLRAPLGEAPHPYGIETAWAWMAKQEARYRARRVLQKGDGPELVAEILEMVRLPRPGMRWVQVDGGGVPWWYVKRYGVPTTSLVVAVGMHAEPGSLYALAYGRTATTHWGTPPDRRSQAVYTAMARPEVQEALRAIHRHLLATVPGLEEAAREAPHLLFVDEAPRGEVRFLLNPVAQATHVLVGGVLLPVSPPYPGEQVAEVQDETLVRVLRERTAMRALSPKQVRELLKGVPPSPRLQGVLKTALAVAGLAES